MATGETKGGNDESICFNVGVLVRRGNRPVAYPCIGYLYRIMKTPTILLLLLLCAGCERRVPEPTISCEPWILWPSNHGVVHDYPIHDSFHLPEHIMMEWPPPPEEAGTKNSGWRCSYDGTTFYGKLLHITVCQWSSKFPDIYTNEWHETYRKRKGSFQFGYWED